MMRKEHVKDTVFGWTRADGDIVAMEGAGDFELLSSKA